MLTNLCQTGKTEREAAFICRFRYFPIKPNLPLRRGSVMPRQGVSGVFAFSKACGDHPWHTAARHRATITWLATSLQRDTDAASPTPREGALCDAGLAGNPACSVK